MENNHINYKLSIEPYERQAFKVPKTHKPRDFILDILATRDQLIMGVIFFLFIVNFYSL